MTVDTANGQFESAFFHLLSTTLHFKWLKTPRRPHPCLTTHQLLCGRSRGCHRPGPPTRSLSRACRQERDFRTREWEQNGPWSPEGQGCTQERARRQVPEQAASVGPGPHVDPPHTCAAALASLCQQHAGQDRHLIPSRLENILKQ